MLLGAITAALLVGTGLACARSFASPTLRGPLALGLAPGVGCAVCAVLSEWGLRSGLPVSVVGVVLLALGLIGLLGLGQTLLDVIAYRRVAYGAPASRTLASRAALAHV